MRRLQRYVLRQTTVAFLASAFALTAMIWLTQALRQIDVLTTKGQTLTVFLAITGLALPALIVVVAPIALFAATAFVLNRINADSELVAMTAAGLSPWAVLRPLLLLAFVVWAGVAYLTLDVMPRSFGALESLAAKLHADLIGTLVRPGAFVEIESGFVFHIRERDPSGALRGLFIQDRRDPTHVTTYVAESGRTIEANGRNSLKLTGGTYMRPERAGESAFVSFEEDTLDLSQLARRGEDQIRRPRERSTLDLLTADPSDPANQRLAGRIRAELVERLTSPMFAFVAVLAAFAGLGRPRTTRQGRGAALAYAGATFALARMAGVGAVNLAANSAIGAAAGFALPVIVCAGCLLVGLSGLPRLGGFALSRAPA